MRTSAKIAKVLMNPRVQYGAASLLLGGVVTTGFLASKKQDTFHEQLAIISHNMKKRDINHIHDISLFVNRFEKLTTYPEMNEFWQLVSNEQLQAYVKNPDDCAKLYMSLMTHLERIAARDYYSSDVFNQVVALRDQVLTDLFAGITSHVRSIEDVKIYQQKLAIFNAVNANKILAPIANIDSCGRFLDYLVKHIDISTLFSSQKQLFEYFRNGGSDNLTFDLVLHDANVAKSYLLKAETFDDIKFVMVKSRERYRAEISTTIVNNLQSPFFANLAKGIRSENDLYYLLTYLNFTSANTNAGLQQKEVMIALADHPVVTQLKQQSIKQLLIKGYSSEAVAYLVQDDTPVYRLSMRY